MSKIVIPKSSKNQFEKFLPDYKDKLVVLDEVDDLSTEVTEEDWDNTWEDEFGGIYSNDGRRLLKAPPYLKDYSIKEGTRVICDEAFSFPALNGIEHIGIPNSVIKIGTKAFRGCFKLSSIFIPKGVTYIGIGAFDSCNLKTIEVETGNNYYDSRNDCNSIIEKERNVLIVGSSMTIIPNDVVEIGENAFSSRHYLANFILPDNVISIGKSAFACCSGIKSIVLPYGVKKIGKNAFSFMKDLSSIKVDIKNDYYDSRDNCNAIINSSNNVLIVGCSSTIIPNTILKIGDSSFSGCEDILSITIPNSVTIIGDSSFSYCKRLEFISIPDSVVEIGNSAFYHCI